MYVVGTLARGPSHTPTRFPTRFSPSTPVGTTELFYHLRSRHPNAVAGRKESWKGMTTDGIPIIWTRRREN